MNRQPSIGAGEELQEIGRMSDAENRGLMARRRFLHKGLWAGMGAFVGRLIFGPRRGRESGDPSPSADHPHDGSELAG